MKYPKEYLDEIKLRLKVSQVVGKTFNLKKEEKIYRFISFQNEKFIFVNDEKEFYHCFSNRSMGIYLIF